MPKNEARFELLYEMPIRGDDRGRDAVWKKFKIYLALDDTGDAAFCLDDGPLTPLHDRDSPSFNETQWASRDYYRWVFWYGVDPLGWLPASGGTIRQRALAGLRAYRRWWSRCRRKDRSRGRWSLQDEIEYRLLCVPWWRRQGRKLVAAESKNRFLGLCQ